MDAGDMCSVSHRLIDGTEWCRNRGGRLFVHLPVVKQSNRGLQDAVAGQRCVGRGKGHFGHRVIVKGRCYVVAGAMRRAWGHVERIHVNWQVMDPSSSRRHCFF